MLIIIMNDDYDDDGNDYDDDNNDNDMIMIAMMMVPKLRVIATPGRPVCISMITMI